MSVNRRGFLSAGLKAAPVAALMAHFGVSQAFAEDMKAQLAEDEAFVPDFERGTLIQVPKSTLTDKQSVWFNEHSP